MTPREPERLTPQAERAREAVRGLGPAPAGAAFRERLKRDFVTGRIGERRVLELPVAWHRRMAWRLALAPVAAALIVVAALANRGPSWTVRGTLGDGIAVVDQFPVPLGHTDELQRRLRPGAHLKVPEGGQVELACAGTMVIQASAGTELTLPASPGRWFGRRVTAATAHGVIRVTTGPEFHGARLHVDTPEASVDVLGTTLAVICEPAGTCVCVFDGVVQVGARGAPQEAVSSGHRRFVFNDGRAPETADIRPAEIGRLGELRERQHGWLEGRSP